jgi:tetratricopeptide (TPR) repeat protein
MHRREPELALVEMRKSVDEFESWESRLFLGLACVANGMEAEALANIDTLDRVATRNELFPTRSAFHQLKGEYQLSLGNYDEATKQFSSARRYYDTLALREVLARAFDAQGESKKAIEQYLYIIKYQFSSFFEGTPLLWPLALYRVADLYERTGDAARAIEYYEKFLESQKNGDPDAWRVVRASESLALLGAAATNDG